MSATPHEPSTRLSTESAWERRRRLDEVFGDVLPEVTVDERDSDTREQGRSDDDWLRAQVPPHHG